MRARPAVATVLHVVSACVLVVAATESGHARPTAESRRLPWGDPDLQGVYSNTDERLVPLERPAAFTGRRLQDITEAELKALRDERLREEVRRKVDASGPTSPTDWADRAGPGTRRGWLIVDPPEGIVPAVIPQALTWAQTRALAVAAHGPADSWEDRGLWERCITRGLPGSMMPEQYGNAYAIVQAPGYVAIRYEMVHETRLIPLDGRPHIGSKIRQYMGDPRGHWEGGTLVVETTNFTSKTDYPGPATGLRLVERFERVGPRTVQWAVTFDDAMVWSRPWTYAMDLTAQDPMQQPLEYACHEGNYALRNILEGARAAEHASGR